MSTAVLEAPTATERDEEKISSLRSKFLDAAKAYRINSDAADKYHNTFTDLVKQAIGAGATVDEIHSWGKSAKLTRQAVNQALRKAGVRQRAERSDKGKGKTLAAAAPQEPSVTGDGGVAAGATTMQTMEPASLAHMIFTWNGRDIEKACAFIEQTMEELLKLG